jgi:hypothetical protein
MFSMEQGSQEMGESPLAAPECVKEDQSNKRGQACVWLSDGAFQA